MKTVDSINLYLCTCTVVFVVVNDEDNDMDVFIEVFLRSKAADSSSIICIFCDDPNITPCDIGGVCTVSRCPCVVEYLSALLLTELYLLLLS